MATMAAVTAFTPIASSTGRFPTLRAQVQEADASPAVSPATVGAGKKKGGKPVIVKQRVVLKFLWLEKNIGIALDQEVPGHGSVPLSPYYFWPRKDAWEELRAKLESKSWISKKRTIILLNQATDIINLWQQTSSAGQ